MWICLFRDDPDGWIVEIPSFTSFVTCWFIFCLWIGGNRYCLVCIGVSSIVTIRCVVTLVFPRCSVGRWNRSWCFLIKFTFFFIFLFSSSFKCPRRKRSITSVTLGFLISDNGRSIDGGSRYNTRAFSVDLQCSWPSRPSMVELSQSEAFISKFLGEEARFFDKCSSVSRDCDSSSSCNFATCKIGASTESGSVSGQPDGGFLSLVLFLRRGRQTAFPDCLPRVAR